ncbi:MAG TPA: metalloregulator ArsR/SmtB family transcription factor [Gemmatales bacterium]|nr:metalloregulator ArsR/SmtB family transcription factor [Gemmatales bacterium]HMP18317.1 metalloregulator ArsR/SmtB family transcription factor [Gemmatales bacterium]
MTQTLLTLEALQQAADCLKVLAHPQRLRMLELLLLNVRQTVGELAEACSIPSNIASGHLRLMLRCDILLAQRDGRYVYYRVKDPCLKKMMNCIKERFS